MGKLLVTENTNINRNVFDYESILNIQKSINSKCCKNWSVNGAF